MLCIERKAFDLVYELKLTANEWKHEDANGDNLWHYAARTQDHRAVKLFEFLQAQNVPSKGNMQGSSPLHEAVQTCDCSMNSVVEPIEWLAANVSEIPYDVYGRTPLHYAFASRDEFAQQLLTKKVRDPIAVVSILTRNMNKQQLNAADCDGNTALHLCAFKNSNICAVTLINKGANVFTKNKEGNSPLALAVLHGSQSVALTLIQGNSSITEQVFFSQPSEMEDNVWKWNGIQKHQKTTVSTIPAQIIARGGEWEALVYVLLEALGTV
ncbi:ankyrin repeat protein [Dictyocaulus viviparus]|uniref:Ankyrin repeat protein n=1 Tax=Dictyocaulus viviparus TaxID=29172 RepID=A0A0D8Y1R3_DICVI|nr:ankyrin repeat protein [Dictyocaulus viviparus]